MKRITTSISLAAIRGVVSALITVSLLLLSPATSAQSNEATPHCIQVGGTIMTNFINENTTLGTATGDLKGAVSATVTPGAGGSFQVLHHWVTEAGDVIVFAPATAVASPFAPGVLGVTYDQIRVTGGTGKFDGANGVLTAFGAADLGHGQTVFRYRGQICFSAPGRP
jgi:hypothetical protein